MHRCKVVQRLLNIPGVRSSIKNNNGRTPLHLAVEQNYIDILDIFANNHRIVHTVATRGTLLHVAVDAGNVSIVSALVYRTGADINARDTVGQTPLHHAVIRQNTTIVMMLVNELGANMNIQDIYGSTPLHHASVAPGPSSSSYCTQILLQHPCTEPNIQNYHGFTPMHMAVITGCVDNVRQLCEHRNIDINVLSTDAKMPLVEAIEIN
ncbi:ankyrin repeat-containing domain protein [Jimgerdemannia flammicorona]|uniref:Ankyrin repeat-containing domain protein n=1 Tax=Jimgerdemannia flammicorona TaxID=994334 RepID=A0A433A1A6_9FUNG|nr:ankyrin repeat-containing domain protein [Jimgerdemannia flammicorona]